MSASLADELVPSVREFNRFYTQVLGLLHEGLNDSPYSLTEVRVLLELAQRDRTEVTAVRRTLDLDPGYLSRILARLAAGGLLTRNRSDGDARRQVVALTDAGRATFATLDARATDQIRALLSRLDVTGERRLVRAMATIRELLDAPGRRDHPPGAAAPRARVELRPLRVGDLGWVVARQSVLNAQEYGYDATFEALVARIVADYASDHDPRREAGWIAELDGSPVGSVFCVAKDAQTAQLRLLLVEPVARGLGVGGRLVDQCLRFAGRASYARIMLWTYDVHAAARRIYERAGFQLDSAEPARAFGRDDLVEQTWSRPLVRSG